MSTTFDLLSTVELGGCSAKIPAHILRQVVHNIPKLSSEKLLVGADSSDDAAVYKINDDCAVISTTDFFPPLVSDPYEFGQIAAANALSDVFAMGGDVTTVLNLVAFPSLTAPIEALESILKGGADKVIEAGGILAGGHTIDDPTPLYGLAVSGVVHPDKIISNEHAKIGDVLILTKPLGSGIVLAAHRHGLIDSKTYQDALDNMKFLNKSAAMVMQKYGIRCCTDITGFGLAGHAMHIALESKVCLEFNVRSIPVLPHVIDLIDSGCIPCGAFKNLDYVKDILDAGDISHAYKMMCTDAQTSGGILMCVPEHLVENVLNDLDTPAKAVIGRVVAGNPSIVLKD